ncbi:MAG: hypothetical protein JO286_14895 [Solirubrobacterales bacterium]|nr:hypothetical protein [Solirubrobacterales bacterium]
MERSEETLSTRDLAQPNEPAADRGAVADSTGGEPERGSVYDQERAAQDEPARGTLGGEQTGMDTRAEEGDRSGAVAPADVDPVTAAGEDESAVGATAHRERVDAVTPSAAGAETGSTAVQDDAVPRQQTVAPGGGAGAVGRAEAGVAGAGAEGVDTPRGDTAGADTVGADTAGAGAVGADRAGAGAVGAGTARAGAVGADTAGAGAAGGTAADSAGDSAPLLSAEASSSFQRRWEEVQTRFVDEPRGAVEEADGLVANLMQQLAEGFAQERERLEGQWDRGEDISTEDLRVALQRYRSFFQRLLSA